MSQQINMTEQLESIADALFRNTRLAAIGCAAANDDLDPTYLYHQFQTLEENITALYDSVVWLILNTKPEGDQPDFSSLDMDKVYETLPKAEPPEEVHEAELEAA